MMIKRKERIDFTNLERKSKQAAWLTIRELRTLKKGGYYDSEGVLHNAEGRCQCTGVVRSTGQRCKNFAVPGELACHSCGGVRARKACGKSRIYSAFIQDPKISAVYESQARPDAEIAGITEELALLRGLLGTVIEERNFDTEEIKDIATVIKEIRQCVSECTKAEIKLGQLIDIGKVMLIFRKLGQIVAKYVDSAEILEKIEQEFSNIPWPAALGSVPQPTEAEPLAALPASSGEICAGDTRSYKPH